MALTAEEVLEQQGFYNNLGLHLAASSDLEQHILDAMEYYNSFGGSPQDILEVQAQNNDLGLQLYAGWIGAQCIAAMETYANQETGICFLVEINDTPSTEMYLTNISQMVIDGEYGLSALRADTKVQIFSLNGLILSPDETVSNTNEEPLPDDNLYDVAIKFQIDGVNYLGTVFNQEIDRDGNGVVICAEPRVEE